ncbi:GGDEF domain-containing protein [Marinobacter alkaliphilus]|uniref:GGDEF domain-containing protein n=1 Tax=Marinobacter alkaliphilus TaxID=254719 RepID=UPI003D767134
MAEYLDQPFSMLIGLSVLVLAVALLASVVKLRTDIRTLRTTSNQQLKRLNARVAQLSNEHTEVASALDDLRDSASIASAPDSSLAVTPAEQENRIIKSILNEGDLSKGLEKAFELLHPSPESTLWMAFGISVLDQNTKTLKLAWHQGIKEAVARQFSEARLIHGSAPHATSALLGEHVVVRREPTAQKHRDQPPATRLPEAVQSWHSFPIKKVDGSVLGTFDILSFNEGFPLPDSNRIANYLFVTSIILERHSYLNGILSQARTDKLTGLTNRGFAEESLVKEIERSQRYRNPLSVVLFDIDHFKSFNDTYGHDVGDLVLQEVSRLSAGAIRATDVLGRWGGEEFLVILSATTLENAMVVAENVRKAVETAHFEVCRSVTISLGVAEFTPHDTAQSLVKRADEALYKAKKAGRNRVLAQSKVA